MTKDEMLETVEEIIVKVEDADGDPEHQHSLEDDIYLAVLSWIETDGPTGDEIREVVSKVLFLSHMEFPRWYA